MSRVIVGDSIFHAWRASVADMAPREDVYDLLVEATTPLEPAPEVIRRADALLVRGGHQTLGTVANTIFPQWLANSSDDRAQLYARYERILPRLRGLRGNGHGTYFGRLISFPPSQFNQLEHVITSISREVRIQGLRHAFEMTIYAPGTDTRPMGFPCMSALSFHREGDSLRLAATYRNQYYFERALGNLIGLARLQAFVANAAHLAAGPLTMHAFHAELDATQSTRDALLAIRED